MEEERDFYTRLASEIVACGIRDFYYGGKHAVKKLHVYLNNPQVLENGTWRNVLNNLVNDIKSSKEFMLSGKEWRNILSDADGVRVHNKCMQEVQICFKSLEHKRIKQVPTETAEKKKNRNVLSQTASKIDALDNLLEIIKIYELDYEPKSILKAKDKFNKEYNRLLDEQEERIKNNYKNKYYRKKNGKIDSKLFFKYLEEEEKNGK